MQERRNWAAVTHSLRGAITWDEWQDLPPFERNALIDWSNELQQTGGDIDG